MTEGSAPINAVTNMHGYCTNLDTVGLNEAFGLTKREYFAAMAMQTLLESMFNGTTIDNLKYVSDAAVVAADSLIEALNEKIKKESKGS